MGTVFASLRWVPLFLSVSASVSAQNEDTGALSNVRRDGPRVRFGVSTAGGALVAASIGQALPGEAWSLDFRGGVQLNDLVALYAQPSIVLGTVNNACFGMTEVVLAFWAPVLIDLTLSNRVSLAIGGGLAAVPGESPGWTVDFRVATYPFMRRLQNAPGREGLMLGFETRGYELNASGQTYAGALFMLAIGYERF